MDTKDSNSKAAALDAPPSLIVYPCEFPIKVMGRNDPLLVQTLIEIASKFDPTIEQESVQTRQSTGAKYLSVTLMIHATSRAQLDALYESLTACPMVKVVL